jgi:hypothetical protein
MYAHGIAIFIHCSFIALQFSVLFSQPHAAIYSEGHPWLSSPLSLLLLPHGLGTLWACERLCAPSPTSRQSLSSYQLLHRWCLLHRHMTIVYSWLGGTIVVFWVARESPTTVDSWPCSLLGVIRLTLRQMAIHLNTATDDDDDKLHSLQLCVLVALPGICRVNGPIPISIYFCFLSRMVVGSIEDVHMVVMTRSLLGYKSSPKRGQ